jgi:hypothetical protein
LRHAPREAGHSPGIQWPRVLGFFMPEDFVVAGSSTFVDGRVRQSFAPQASRKLAVIRHLQQIAHGRGHEAAL